MEEYKLCYIEGDKAWFTNNFEEQWGDDWDDKPYECNAGYPYGFWSELIEDNPDIFKKKWRNHEIKHKMVCFDTNCWNEKQPKDIGKFSVEEINKRVVPWLQTVDYDIYAGTTYEKFISIIENSYGKIYVERERK